MAVLTVQRIVKTGLEPTFAAATSGGDSYPNTGAEYAEVINGSESDITVTVAAQVNCNFGVDSEDHDVVVTVTAGERRKLGSYPPEFFNDSNGRVQLTYSAVTTVTVGVFSE